MLPLVLAAWRLSVAAGGRRDVMIWTDCAPETMCADPSPPDPTPSSLVGGGRAQLARHRPAFTKLSPFNAGIGLRADGRVGLQSSTDNVTNIAACAAAIHGTFRGSVEYWPCVSVGPGSADLLMPKLFADPSGFIADAIALSKQLGIA